MGALDMLTLGAGAVHTRSDWNVPARETELQGDVGLTVLDTSNVRVVDRGRSDAWLVSIAGATCVRVMVLYIP